jgi:hypothetical protein
LIEEKTVEEIIEIPVEDVQPVAEETSVDLETQVLSDVIIPVVEEPAIKHETYNAYPKKRKSINKVHE